MSTSQHGHGDAAATHNAADGDRLAILLHTQDMQAAVREITSYLGAQVSQKLSASILIAHLPTGFDTGVLTKSGTIDNLDPCSLDIQSQLMLQAWKASQFKKRTTPPSPTQGLAWDTPSYQPPGKDDPSSILSAAESFGTPTSLHLTGSVALGLIIVSGEPGELRFTPDEQTKVVQEVLDAQDFLAMAEPAANITFTISRLEHVTVSRNKLVPKTSMSETPSAVLFNGKIYCFHQSRFPKEELWYNVFDGSTWAGDTKVDNTGITKWPSAVVYNDKIYCFHNGVTSDNGDLWYNVFDGSKWEGDKRVPNTKIFGGPSCVVFQGKVYCFYQGHKDNNELWYNVFDGSSWEGHTRIDTNYITSGLSAVVFKGKLYYFYRGNDVNAELWYNVLSDNKWEGDKKILNTNLSASPSGIVHQGKLHCFHQGSSSNGELWCNKFDGNDWSGGIRVADVSMSQGPSTVSFQGQLYCFYQGAGNNGQMRYSSFDDVTYEGIWRDPALRSLGFPSGYAGCVDFVKDLKKVSGADWSYVAFFTKYPQTEFAYAGGVRISMQYANGSWGPDQINKVFAHETCHIFGATNEYGNCGCGPSGFYKVNNGNCKNCTSHQVSCLMHKSELTFCSFSRGQVGWLPRSGLFVFHQGFVRNQKLWYTVFDGQAWWTEKLVHETGMSAGPGAVMVKNDLFLFHNSSGATNELWYNVFVSGANWRGDAKVPNARITASPSIVLFNNKIFCFFAGLDSLSQWLWYNVLDLDKNEWVGEKQIPNTNTTLGPSATTFNNKIYCFHQGQDYNGELWFNVFDGSSWQGDKKVPNSFMSSEPAVVIYNDKLYCFYQGGRENGELWYNVFDGATWAGDKQVSTKKGMSEGPSVAVLHGKLYCFFQGRGKNGQLWYMVFDGTDWSVDQRVPQAGIQSKPCAIYASFT